MDIRDRSNRYLTQCTAHIHVAVNDIKAQQLLDLLTIVFFQPYHNRIFILVVAEFGNFQTE
ncbi:hypothetical protein D3C87_2019760 [compost metagenome]